MSVVKVSHPSGVVNATVQVPGSKSESNRMLILNALSGGKLKIANLSAARDTQRLQKILLADEEVIDVLDAGTSMRFLTAYLCVKNFPRTITGTERMCERPIKPLVTALNQLGFDVRYSGNDGFPPIKIYPVDLNLIKSEVAIEGNVSSQYITALLLIAPFLTNGLHIRFTTAITSKPYIEMTLQLLRLCGVNCTWESDGIRVKPSKLSDTVYNVGGDWSSASYWYSIAFLSKEAEILVKGLRDDWSQGDREMAEWMKRFGIITKFTEQGAVITKTRCNYPRIMKMNFADNPDLAQTFAVMFAAGSVLSTFSGLDSLRIKETDRIVALQTELRKLNIRFDFLTDFELYQLRGDFSLPHLPINTYGDHRMAMSFAPLGLLGEIIIENPDVVQKSYPDFWKNMEKAGFITQYTSTKVL